MAPSSARNRTYPGRGRLTSLPITSLEVRLLAVSRMDDIEVQQKLDKSALVLPGRTLTTGNVLAPTESVADSVTFVPVILAAVRETARERLA